MDTYYKSTFTRKTTLLIMTTLYIITVAQGQTQISFQETVGGLRDEVGHSVQQTQDSGYIFAGMTMSFGGGSDDFYLIKTNIDGQVLWTKTFGGALDDDAHFVQQTSDNGYIVVGRTESFGAGGSDIFLVKTDITGNLVWSKTYGGPLSDDGNVVQQTTDGGYIITGTTSNFGAGDNDIYLIKTNSFGDTLWTKTYGGANADFGNSVQQTSDGGYLIAGTTWSFSVGSGDAYLIKTDVLGDTLWTKAFGGTMGEHIYAGQSLQQTSDGGYIIVGHTYSFGAGNADLYLIKTNSSGNLLWSKTFGGISEDYGQSVRQTNDGGFILSGTIYSFGAGNSDAYLVKTDSDGNLLWSKTYGWTEREEGVSVRQTLDGGYIIVGLTTSFVEGRQEFYIVKTDSIGNSECYHANPASITSTPATQVSYTQTIISSGSVVTSPTTIVSSGEFTNLLCHSTSVNEIRGILSVSVYPNPFSIQTTLMSDKNLINANLIIYNSYGQKVKQFENVSGYQIIFNRGNLPIGLYSLHLSQDNKILATEKIIIVDD